jgi:Arc/MetJ-type ribon-helix-helix transcriptional regulator
MDMSGLPSDLATFVQEGIASGKYQSEAELVTEAVRLLKAQKTETNGDTDRDETSQSSAQLAAHLEHRMEATQDSAFLIVMGGQA